MARAERCHLQHALFNSVTRAVVLRPRMTAQCQRGLPSAPHVALRMQVNVPVQGYAAVSTVKSCRVWGRPGNSIPCFTQSDSNTSIYSSRQAHPAGPLETGLAVGPQPPRRLTLGSQLPGGLPGPAGRPSSPGRRPPPLAACWQLQAGHKSWDGPVSCLASLTHLAWPAADGCLLAAAGSTAEAAWQGWAGAH